MKNTIAILVSFVALLNVSGCSSSEETARESGVQVHRSGSKPINPEPQVENYVIRQGDSISVSVWGFSQFNTNGLVKANGTLNIPLLGDVIAAGLTKDQLIDDLNKKLKEYIQGEIKLTVTVVSSVVKKITVLGAVVRQENYAVPSDLTLSEALAVAGGVTPEADLKHIRILRSGMNGQPIEVDLSSYIEQGNFETMPIIRAGDTVFVPKDENLIRDLSIYMGSAVLLFSFFVLFK